MNRIRELRKSKQIKMVELAKAVGISAPYLFDIEKEHRKGSKDTLEKIAVALGVSVSELFEK